MPNLDYHLFSSQQIRQVEQTAINNLNISGYQLMQAAGQAAFNALQQHWPGCQRIILVCGAGNNAGDGYSLARLALESGIPTYVQTLVNPEHLKGDALTAYQAFIRVGGRVESYQGSLPALSTDSIIVDALFGTGLNREPTDSYSTAIKAINASACPVLAIDIPSGLQADTGCVLGIAVQADITVTFIGLKTGLYTGQAADYTGKVMLADLHLPKTAFAEIAPSAQLMQKKPLAIRSRCAHKGQFGHVLLIGGNIGYSGAIRLAAEAALRSGAGLVSIATRQAHYTLLNSGRPELMCHGVETASDLLNLIARASVIVIGPGLGQDVWSQTLFDTVMSSDKPCVVDADALNLLAKQPAQQANWLLTPHPGEAGRLLNCSTPTINQDRYTAVKTLQQRYGGVCLLKGAGSLLADAENTYVCTKGNPGMASGGMGDVLSGVMAGLLAQGLSLLDAGQLAIISHAEAADYLANQYGEIGLLASDLLPKIRHCIQNQ